MAKAEIERARGLRLLEPGPTVLVTSMFRSQPNVMTAAWIQPAGFDPPIIAVSVHPGRFSHELITRSEMFGISVPTMDLLWQVHLCGTVSGRSGDKFEAAGLTPEDSEEIEAPGIEECIAHLECGVTQRLRFSDHDLFIAEILFAKADQQYFVDQWVSEGGLPLVNHIAGDQYAGLSRTYRAVNDEAERE